MHRISPNDLTRCPESRPRPAASKENQCWSFLHLGCAFPSGPRAAGSAILSWLCHGLLWRRWSSRKSHGQSTRESLSRAGERRGTDMSTVSPADQAVPDQQSWKQGPLPSSGNTFIPASALALAENQRCSQDMVQSAHFFQ
ncbi:hypothetical protein AV530_008272 [Patagioenas fasciata monilis]|uniref:Uncharacterized protein n=1 Tax=Patagioenas fasciata monilis TaxID=372326 RepID=A0A1V4KWG8_PATFA|nr:hypothetical protein AV530_008272 [Patagioenas fasciata monilis]